MLHRPVCVHHHPMEAQSSITRKVWLVQNCKNSHNMSILLKKKVHFKNSSKGAQAENQVAIGLACLPTYCACLLDQVRTAGKSILLTKAEFHYSIKQWMKVRWKWDSIKARYVTFIPPGSTLAPITKGSKIEFENKPLLVWPSRTPRSICKRF